MTIRRKFDAGSRDGYMSVFYRSIILGFLATLSIEYILGGPAAAGLAPEIVLGLPTGVGLLCGVGTVSIHRRWGARGILVAGWTTGMMLAGLLIGLQLCVSLARTPHLGWLWGLGFPIGLIGGGLGGYWGYRLGLRKIATGERDVPA